MEARDLICGPPVVGYYQSLSSDDMGNRLKKSESGETHRRNPFGDRILDTSRLGRLNLLALVLTLLALNRSLHTSPDASASRVTCPTRRISFASKK